MGEENVHGISTGPVAKTERDLAEARAEIARLGEFVRELSEVLCTGEAVSCDYGKLAAYREALERIAEGATMSFTAREIAREALDTQARAFTHRSAKWSDPQPDTQARESKGEQTFPIKSEPSVEWGGDAKD